MMLLLAIIAPWAANAQTSLFSEDFEGGSMPAGWTTDGSGSWSVGVGDYSTSTGAGHGSYNAKITHGSTGNVTKLITPEIDLSSVASAELSFMHVQRSWAGDIDELRVYYRTSSSEAWTMLQEYTNVYGSWTTEEGIALPNPSSTYQIAFEYTDNYGYGLGIDAVSILPPATCPKPTGLNVALTPGDGTVATLSWTSDADAWQICLNGDETNLIAATTNPYTLTGLTPETTYTAKVRTNCGSEQSDWSNEVTFKPTDAIQLTVNDGTSTNSYVPYYAYYHDSQQRSEFIIPASSLSDLAWGTITSMKFYPNYTYTTSASIKVYLMEVEEETFSDVTFYGETDATVVYDGTLSISPNGMTIAFAGNGFRYIGGNLLVGFYQSASGSGYYSSSTCPFYGVSATGASISQYSSYSGLRNFLPKTTFDYIPGEAPACMWPTNLAVSNIGARSVELSWTENGEATAWQIGYQVVGGTEQYVEVSTNPYTLTGLTPDTDYEVRVQSKCSDTEYSTFTNFVSFTTEPSCYAPTDMVISDITAYSANVAWTSENTNIEMRYSPDVRPITNFDDSQMHGWTNIDADGDGYEWVLGSACGGIYLVEGGSLAGTGHNSSADMVTSGSYSNFTQDALTPDNYLVSPQITLGGSITFWACAQDGSYAAEHFGVAVSTTGNTDAADFTTIAEWTFGSRSANVLRSSNAPRGGNRDQAEWVQYTVDLSAYSGQGYVAIRHFDCTDMFMLNVDDINIEQPGFELPWVYVTNPASPQALTNLEPETDYIVQVRANCGENGVSEWLEGTFTTLPSCMVPTGLVVSNIDKRSADIAWTSNGDEEAWQICVNGDEENLIYVTDTAYTLTDLLPDQTRYIVKVRAYCDEQLQSAWSSPVTFYTLIACPAPTNLFISDITNVSAVATWTYDGDVELEYAEDVWRHYDNGVYSGGIGTGGSDVYWAIMLPPTMLPTEPLTKVSLFEATGYSEEPITLMIYSGGDTAPGTLLYQEEVTPLAADDFHEITLAEPVTFDATQNLWIVCKEYGTYPAIGCNNVDEPNGRWISLDGTEWVDVMVYSLDYTWMIRAAFGNNTQTEWVAVNNPASPQTIAGLTPETPYFVRLRAVCGGEDGESVWVNTIFTTDIACPAPTALAATPYANSAVLSWEGISESYTVSYRTAAYTQGVSEEFATSSAPTGWTRSNTLLTDDVLNGTTALATYNGGWNFGTSNGVFDSHARVNIYGTSCKYWLVTPAMEVPTGAEFSFDLALTAYSGTVAAPATTGTDDKFVVLVSTDNMATWTILRQWDNAGSEYVYNNIANTATGENVSFDFSAYAGQTVYVAFYGESTTSNADNNLHIDNVAIGTAMPAGEWMTVNVDEATATITGLTPETKYEWKVQGDCGDFGMSEESAIMSFTTTNDLCPVPTNLTVNNETITATTADLSWEGSPDVESFTVRYRAPEHVVGGLSETFDVAGVPAGWTRYSGLVNDVIAGTATLTTTTSGWNYTDVALGAYNMKVNIYGTSAKYWLVTPEVTPTNGNFSFDLALTDYGNADPIEDATAQADDRFVVLVYANDAWTILREWNNTGSDYVYNTIATEGEAVSIDLSAYVGQAVKIAFYGESTASGGDNDLHIDNVVIGNPQTIPATDWQLVEGITDMNVTLTGLTPETPYEAQVKADCSDPEAWSNTLNFTTPAQTNVTQTIAFGELLLVLR